MLSTSSGPHGFSGIKPICINIFLQGETGKTCITFSLPFMALGKGKMIKNVLPAQSEHL